MLTFVSFNEIYASRGDRESLRNDKLRTDSVIESSYRSRLPRGNNFRYPRS